ncbi:DUF3221 domain-containing protein [Paenibacillus sp. FSL P4-0338]|uniref:DUF3221 domain-containing protein n=1 Tax=unclassified Paenibacillus TaxID=185978 RepID=UPI0003E2C08C|nr:DUF3221 domain-containing protein [Paenibacillus sp. FSL R7-269]ETT56328.1 hypothetical protein C162_01474 [Paenibacillus sp. FSL R7-269]
MLPKTTISKWALIFMFLLVVTACSKDDTVFKGTVHTVDVDNKRILVIAQLKEEDLSKNYKEVLETNMYSQAIWVNEVSPSKYKKGEEIEVFYQTSDDSFPAQVTANKIVKSKIEQ